MKTIVRVNPIMTISSRCHAELVSFRRMPSFGGFAQHLTPWQVVSLIDPELPQDDKFPARTSFHFTTYKKSSYHLFYFFKITNDVAPHFAGIAVSVGVPLVISMHFVYPEPSTVISELVALK